jgi:hypothetical protein
MVLGRGAPLAVAAVLLATAAVAGDSTPARPVFPAVQDFLDNHWRRPLRPQGPPPAGFSPVEASLEPANCGTCHPAQLADWKTSLHAQSMGPGITGQLAEMWKTDRESARLCLSCHAPLAEQQPENPAIYDPRLARQGLTCAACHVREHERFGPPRREPKPQAREVGPEMARHLPRARSAAGDPGRSSTQPDAQGSQRLPHRGATRTAAFLASEFCSSCHQFDPDGFALNGKLLENTYAEWKVSPAARRGQQCQDCHMPDRRHLWRGIHDPAMTRSAVVITTAIARPRYRPGEHVSARLTITNAGAGHHFPTYVTPRVVVRAVLVDAAGREIAGSVEERVIAREVTLDLSRELFDTRLAAGGAVTIDYRRRLQGPGLRLRVVLTVHPDHFYTRFFESLLDGGAGRGTDEIRQALAATRRSSYELYRREIPLT